MFYIFLIATLNLVIGFAVAVRLGQRYRAVAMADESWESNNLAQSDEESATPDDADDSDEQDSDETSPEDADTEANEGESEEKSESVISVEALQAEVGEFNDQLLNTDDQLRACLETPDVVDIKDVLGSLRDAAGDFVEKRNEAHENFSQAHEEDEGFDFLRAEIEAAIADQNESVESVNEAIDSFDYEGDSQDGCQRMIDETAKLIDGNRQLAGGVEQAAVEVARREEHSEAVDESPATPPKYSVSLYSGALANSMV
jgi:hypothetical protein